MGDDLDRVAEIELAGEGILDRLLCDHLY